MTGEAAQISIVKMFYLNFNSQITAKHGVVMLKWPLKKFQSPSNMASMTEISVLHNAWKTGTIFCKVMQLEWKCYARHTLCRSRQNQVVSREVLTKRCYVLDSTRDAKVTS